MTTLYKLKDYTTTLVFEKEHPKQLRWDDKYKMWMLSQSDQCQGFWLKDKDKLVAELIVTWHSKNILHGDSITVLPDYRRKGLATELIDKMLEWAESSGFEIFTGEARKGSSWNVFENMGAKPLFLHKDWHGTGEDYMFFKMDI